MKIVVVSGLSGSGKSVALGALEDLGYYCIDNLPLSLLGAAGTSVLLDRAEELPQLAIGMDARSRSRIDHFPGRIEELRRAGIETYVFYFTADNDVILKRYSETRRKHPLTDANTSLVEAIARERELLRPIARIADTSIDTSRTNFHQLRELVKGKMLGHNSQTITLLFQSFGYKYGIPEGLDFVFDVRCLPNPHWHEPLRALTGLDAAVIEFLNQQSDCTTYLQQISAFLEYWLPRFHANDRSYLSVGIGCTGGQHRSVYMVQALADHFRERYPETVIRHTELQ